MRNIKNTFSFILLATMLMALACRKETAFRADSGAPDPFSTVTAAPTPAEIKSVEIKKILASAAEQNKITRGYDPAYVVLPYPNGDVSPETGVCSDVVIRAFRQAGVDLQKEVHEDMRAAFAAYPKKWGLTAPDSNIDHRRVPNLQTFFARRGKSLAITNKTKDYLPGDVVAWDLNGKGMTHIGLVSNTRNPATGQYFIVHNIGGGVKTEDVLFDWKIIGHYRYF